MVTKWEEMEARLLDLELNQMSQEELLRTFGTDDTAKLVIAVTKALKTSIGEQHTPLTLWIHESYGRNGIVTIGMNEHPDRVNFEGARQCNVPVFVRESGGWTIYNSGGSYVFVNVFANPTYRGFERFGKIGDAFKFNSDILIKALGALSPPVYAEILEGDPSSINVDVDKDGDGRCIAMNAAHTPKGLVYLEGAVRYSRKSLDTASKVLILNDDEREDLFRYNAAVEEFSPDKERLREALIKSYVQSSPFNSYQWKPTSLTGTEIELTRGFLPGITSLTELSTVQLKTIGKHPAKICDVHWLMRKYGTYTPGTY